MLTLCFIFIFEVSGLFNCRLNPVFETDAVQDGVSLPATCPSGYYVPAEDSDILLLKIITRFRSH